MIKLCKIYHVLKIKREYKISLKNDFLKISFYENSNSEKKRENVIDM